MRNYIRSTTTTTGLTVKAFLVDRAFQKGRKVSKEQRQTITHTTYLSNLELYDCTNTDILNLNQTATLFADITKCIGNPFAVVSVAFITWSPCVR